MSERLAILGAPRTGKTALAGTLATERNCAPRSTDELIGLGWSEASEAAAAWFDDPANQIIEGVAVARALRKWLAAHPEGKPVDRLIILTNAPFEAHTPGQATMGKGINTVLAEIEPQLRARGVAIERRKQ